MKFVLNHVWVVGITLAVFGTAFIFLVGISLAVFVCWLQIRGQIKSGRTIKWEEALVRCMEGPVVIVIELRKRPQRVWFLTGNDESAFFSRRGRPRYKGLLVLGAPDVGCISEEVKKAGGRVVDVDMNATLW